VSSSKDVTITALMEMGHGLPENFLILQK